MTFESAVKKLLLMMLFTACVNMLIFRPRIDYAKSFNLKYIKNVSYKPLRLFS